MATTEIDTFTIDVLGVPVPQPRGRSRAFAGHAQTYDPGTADQWKVEIAEAAGRILPAEPIAGPVSLSVDFRFPRPKSHFRAKAGTLKPVAPYWRTAKRGDIDNCLKAVMDALTRVRLWWDDSQVVHLADVRCRYTRAGERPGARIVVVRQSDPPAQRGAP